jgi:membrane complex biogenesis BtpA family protein
MTNDGNARPKSNDVERLCGRRDALIGMVHLRPLPGAPRYRPEEGCEVVYNEALAEARILEAAGFDGVIVENGGDIPFLPPDRVGPETVAAMAVALRVLHDEVRIPIGVNCLANAVEASIAVAAAAGGAFVRSNQWANAYVANEGIIEGRAGEATRFRRAIGAEQVTVWADVKVKLGSHAITADRSLSEQARDMEWFDADALIVTGSRLADPPILEDIRAVREATDLAVIVGSGVTAENLGTLLAVADAAVVGSALKEGGVWWGAMSLDAVERIAGARDKAAKANRSRA